MTHAEIRRKFDEIVAFAEVEKFLDTPVKRYSSGMYVRLAFAVAAHLEPEILVVDEVLAVGDAEFQQKCLGKMSEVAAAGRTVLFVSHNITAVRQLCRNGIWLQGGRIVKMGPTNVITKAYLDHTRGHLNSGDFRAGSVTGDGRIELLSYRVINGHGELSRPPVTNEDLLIQVRLNVKENISRPAVGIDFTNEFGILLTSLNTVEQGTVLPPLRQGEVTISVRVKRIAFLPGLYISNFLIMNLQEHIYIRAESCIAFEIAPAPIYGTREVDHRWGCVYSELEFSVEPLDDG
jgi:lipopolysaccharide transport system ATP-binding protein